MGWALVLGLFIIDKVMPQSNMAKHEWISFTILGVNSSVWTLQCPQLRINIFFKKQPFGYPSEYNL